MGDSLSMVDIHRECSSVISSLMCQVISTSKSVKTMCSVKEKEFFFLLILVNWYYIFQVCTAYYKYMMHVQCEYLIRYSS